VVRALTWINACQAPSTLESAMREIARMLPERIMYAADVTTVLQYTVVGLSILFAFTLLVLEIEPPARKALDTRRAKRRLRDEIGSLRLLHMLHRRGISLRSFVQALTPTELRRAAATCRGCERVDTCEDVLRGQRPGGDYAFCPGNAAIGRVVHTVALNRL
jgi:hypothetical protein